MCKVENCLRQSKDGAKGYCPTHAPKPWHNRAVGYFESDDHDLDLDETEAITLQGRARDVFGQPGKSIPLDVIPE